jgi:L-threonylcarbamoyladenylate synthase
LKRGGLLGFPTETVYGLGGVASSGVKKRLQAMKGRKTKRPIGLFVCSIAQVRKITSQIPSYADKLMRRFWPGPLTLVFQSSNQRLRPLLHQGTIGIRIPRQKWLLTVLRRLGRPLLQTSANLSGHSPARTAGEVQRLFGERLNLIIDAGQLKKSKPSTVVDASGPVPIILRKGLLSQRELERALKMKIHVSDE